MVITKTVTFVESKQAPLKPTCRLLTRRTYFNCRNIQVRYIIRFTFVWWCMACAAAARSATGRFPRRTSVRSALGFCAIPDVARYGCWPHRYRTNTCDNRHQQPNVRWATSKTSDLGGASDSGRAGRTTSNLINYKPTTINIMKGDDSYAAPTTLMPSLSDFLTKQKARLTDEGDHQQKLAPLISHVSVGNPAGDADSIVSAIALAYIDSMTTTSSDDFILPVISVTEQALRTHRPETTLLLEWAGIRLDDLVCVDHPGLERLAAHHHNDCPNPLQVTLLDHNRLDLSANPWLRWNENAVSSVTVTEILDHHFDEMAHLDSCPLNSPGRNIAFHPDSTNQPALVASTTTLLVERYLAATAPSLPLIPTPLATLLLGVILLDSVNLSEQANKVTARDVAAINALVEQTDWSSSSDILLQPSNALLEKYFMSPNRTSLRPQTTKWFEALQNQKFSPTFWSQLNVLNCLGLDYKSFTSSANVSFGVATVLTSLSDLLTSKSNVTDQLLEFIQSQNIAVLGIMCATSSEGKLTREFALASTSKNAALVESLVNFLLTSETGEVLQLEQVTLVGRVSSDALTSAGLALFTARQHNSGMSRKQVVPILLAYWQ
jgi:exopolyphosphatase